MMVEEPESENSLFSEPMKRRTPSASSARPNRSTRPRLVSRSSNKERTRSRSARALRSSSRLAWPRTISLRSALSPPDQLASPASTRRGLSAPDSAAGPPPPGPARDPRLAQPVRERIELGAARLQRLLDLALGFGERPAADA